MTETLLALDAGTTGVTAVLFDRDLRPLAQATRELPQHFPRPGWVEHDADDILSAVDAVCGEVLVGRGSPSAVGITNQRETVFALDLDTGRALGRGIVWQDRRTARRCDALRQEGHEELVRRVSGLRLDPYFSGTKVEWMLRERPAVAGAAARGRVRFCTVDALLVHHLTMGEHCATEPTNASRTLLFDLERRAWSPELCGLLSVAPELLPEVRPSTGDFGRALLPGGRTAPIRGIAGDQQAALFGQGCWDEGSFKNTYGTGCFLLVNTGARRVTSTGGLLTTLGVGRGGETCFALEGAVFVGGSLVQWLRDQLGILQTAAQSEEVALSVPDAGGVHVVPAFTGLGAPYWDPDARGAIVGLTRGTTRGHIVRAALESIAFQCAELVELVRAETGLAIGELLVDGGATNNALLMQTQADLAGLTVVRPPNVESTARGAAALAGLGLGLWRDPAEAGAFRDEPLRFHARSSEDDRRARLAEWRGAVARVLTR